MKYILSLHGDDTLVNKNEVKFLPQQYVYIVKLKRKKVHIIETQIDYISYVRPIGDINPYNLLIRYHIYYDNRVYWNDSNNIFSTKEEAYEYAEHLDRRKNIVFKH